MPSKTRKQHNFMVICSVARKKAKKKCPPKKVVREFLKADKHK